MEETTLIFMVPAAEDELSGMSCVGVKFVSGIIFSISALLFAHIEFVASHVWLCSAQTQISRLKILIFNLRSSCFLYWFCMRLVFFRLQDYNRSVERKRKVSTLLCRSYLKETIVKKWGVFMEKKLPACPVETTLMLISDRWKVLIIRDLLDGTKRFGEIKKSVGNVSQKVLTANLRSMEDSGLLTRKVYPEVPPRVEYTLTKTGYSLKPILDAMVEWGTEYKMKNS